MNNKIVMVSGGFDPLHPGHLALFDEARTLGTAIFAVIDSDEYVSSKHKLQMTQTDRAAVVSLIKGIVFAIHSSSANGDCSDILETYRPSIYLVGPEYTDHTKLPEYETCQRLGIEIKTAQFPREKDWHSSKVIGQEYKNPIVTVSCLIHNIDNEVLLSIRGLEDGKGAFELPGGFLEVGEDLEECVRREVREELDVGLSQLEYFASYQGKYADGRDIISIYFRAYIDGVPIKTKESSGVIWVVAVPDSKSFYNDVDKQALTDFLGE